MQTAIQSPRNVAAAAAEELAGAAASCCLTVDLPPGPCAIEATGLGLRRVALQWRDSTAVPWRGRSEVQSTASGPDSFSGLEVAVEVARAAADQLLAYLEGHRRSFELPLDLRAFTPFQRRVLLACAGITYGATLSYGELAERAGAPRAARAVGQVMARNPLPLVVPCHRVVAAAGPGGFGYGAALKQRLLAMEREGRGWQ